MFSRAQLLAPILALTLGVSLTSKVASASVIYNWGLSSYTLNALYDPQRGTPNLSFYTQVFGPIIVTDSELSSKTIIRMGDGINNASYNLTINADGTLSGSINGLLAAFDYKLSGSNSIFSGTLISGDVPLNGCDTNGMIRGCAITGTFFVPEPASLLTVTIGAGALLLMRRRRLL